MGKGILGSLVIVVDDEGNSVFVNMKGNIVVLFDLLVFFKGYYKELECMVKV